MTASPSLCGTAAERIMLDTIGVLRKLMVTRSGLSPLFGGLCQRNQMSDDRPESPLARAKREYLEALAAVKMLENGLDPDDYVYEVGKPLRRKERVDV